MERPRTTAVRASTSSDPRRRTFQPACRTAAARARANASGGTRGEPLGRGEERATEPAPEVVPATDPRACLGAHLLRIRRGIALVGDPAAELRVRHLGVGLHTPTAVAAPERPQRSGAVRGGGSLLGQGGGVGGPDEAPEPGP